MNVILIYFPVYVWDDDFWGVLLEKPERADQRVLAVAGVWLRDERPLRSDQARATVPLLQHWLHPRHQCQVRNDDEVDANDNGSDGDDDVNDEGNVM